MEFIDLIKLNQGLPPLSEKETNVQVCGLVLLIYPQFGCTELKEPVEEIKQVLSECNGLSIYKTIFD